MTDSYVKSFPHPTAGYIWDGVTWVPASDLVPGQYDYIELGYTGSDLTSVIYKTGGVGGTIVATLTLTYTGGNLISVTKT